MRFLDRFPPPCPSRELLLPSETGSCLNRTKKPYGGKTGAIRQTRRKDRLPRVRGERIGPVRRVGSEGLLPFPPRLACLTNRTRKTGHGRKSSSALCMRRAG